MSGGSPLADENEYTQGVPARRRMFTWCHESERSLTGVPAGTVDCCAREGEHAREILCISGTQAGTGPSQAGGERWK